MKALLLVAHGSRREVSNREIRSLATRVREIESDFDHIDCAFLELAEPSIPDGMRRAIHAGAKELVVLPYFLSAGRHVSEDIPVEVDGVRTEFPDVHIMLAPYLGASPGISRLLITQAALA
ncbi:MAG: CbiX/SirB N-terminal domain-containing protein [Gammaproteobacteria bacterium]|nr:MAG: CbiX/SirB N-terminal domain-containing protein [Gammaproteobacteria bacterium]